MGVCFSTISFKKNRTENIIKVTTLENTFYLWRIAVVVSLRKRESERHSTRLAELHQRIADNEETVANAVRILYCPRNETASSSHTCVVCLNETTQQFVQCGFGHCICESCIDTICETAVQKRECTTVACPSPTECRGTIDESNLSKTVWGRKLLHECHHQSSIATALDLLETNTFDDASMKLRYLRHDGSYAAYQCPSCEFGPLEHLHCDDLVEWHLREGHDNSCPRCGHAVTNVQELTKWNGNLG